MQVCWWNSAFICLKMSLSHLRSWRMFLLHIEIYVDRFFPPLSTLKISFHCCIDSFHCIASDENSEIIFYLCSPIYKASHSLLVASNIFCLVFKNLTIMYQGAVYFVFFLLGYQSVLGLCADTFDQILKIFSHYFFKYSLSLPIPPSLSLLFLEL